MSKKTSTTTKTNSVDNTPPGASEAHADFRAGHNGHRLTHVGDIVNTINPKLSLDPRSGVPGRCQVWYCEKDDVIFLDARDMTTAPTITNTGKGTALDFVTAGLRQGHIMMRVGQIVNASLPQDASGTAATLDLWYDATTNTVFVDSVS